MRLIDADALRASMYHDAFETDTDLQKWDGGCWIRYKMFERNIESAPSIDAVQVVRCKDCLFGHLCFDVQNGVTDSWVDCRNPEGLYRDVSLDGYCSASIRKK